MNKLEKIISDLPYTSARSIALICGKIISTQFVVGYAAQLKTRRLFELIASSSSWDGRVNMSNWGDAIGELFFWKRNFHSMNFKYISQAYIPPLRAYSDASSTGLAAHIAFNGGVKIAYRNFSPNETNVSSTEWEMLAVEFALHSFLPYVKNSKIMWHT